MSKSFKKRDSYDYDLDYDYEDFGDNNSRKSKFKGNRQSEIQKARRKSRDERDRAISNMHID